MFILCNDIMEIIGKEVVNKRKLRLFFKLWIYNMLEKQLFGDN